MFQNFMHNFYTTQSWLINADKILEYNIVCLNNIVNNFKFN